MADLLVPIVMLLGMPPLLQGVIVKTKAAFAGRRGAPLLQPYRDLARLLRKGMVISRTTSWIFLAGPALSLATTFAAGLLLPLGANQAQVHFTGDLVLFAYLLALGRFFTVAAALDTGSAFEGMGSAREITFACLTEPALFLGMLALARITGSLELSGMLGSGLHAGWGEATPALVLVTTGLMVVALAEGCRIPFDDPNTHLELTMIHEVMVLDHSGPALATIQYGAAMKQFLFGSILVRLAVPALPAGAGGWAVFAVLLILFAVLVGTIESAMARLRMIHVPTILIGAIFFTGFGLLFTFLD